MSHFSVCAAIPNSALERAGIGRALEEILAPYEENPVSGEYMEFQDQTEECWEAYPKDTVRAVRFPDGSLHGLFSPEFMNDFTIQENRLLEKTEDGEKETERSRALELLDACPVKKFYTFEEYCRKHCNYTEENGSWGYWCNPNARWDWYSIGGRFSDKLLVKKTSRSAIGMVSGPDGYLSADGALVGEIAWEEMKRRERAAAEKYYGELRTAFISGDGSDLGPLAYMEEDGIRGWGTMLYKAGETLEEYLYRSGLGKKDRYVMPAYAFVDLNGKWHAQGDMGWFGVSSNDKEERAWRDEVQAFLSTVWEKDYLVMLDCHI